MLENKSYSNGKKIIPRKDPILHGNSAKIDPQKSLISEYQFYSVTPANTGKGDSNLPVADKATLLLAKQEVDENHK